MTDVFDIYLQSAPWELQAVIPEFWPDTEYHNAARIAYLESEGFNALALNDSTSSAHPCGSTIGYRDGVRITAERSVSYFQINTCNFPEVPWYHFFNARLNAEYAYRLWVGAGGSWSPWYFSAKRLGLI